MQTLVLIIVMSFLFLLYCDQLKLSNINLVFVVVELFKMWGLILWILQDDAADFNGLSDKPRCGAGLKCLLSFLHDLFFIDWRRKVSFSPTVLGKQQRPCCTSSSVTVYVKSVPKTGQSNLVAAHWCRLRGSYVGRCTVHRPCWKYK